MRRLLGWADALFTEVAALFSFGFLVCVSLQVLFRYVLEKPLPWSEELARYLFVWAALLAAAVMVGRNDNFSISILVERFPVRGRWAFDVLGAALGGLFVLIVLWKGAAMSWRMSGALSPVLQISQGLVYAVIPLSALYMLVHLLVRLVTLLRGGPSAAAPTC
jgi:TRAP-type C4-dicarboxylate transport system permease small subunit